MYSDHGYRGRHASSTPWAVSSTAGSNYRSRHMRQQKRRRRIVIIVLISLIVLLAIPFLTPLFPQVDRRHLTSEDLPADIGQVRIVFVTDIHYGFWFSDARLNSLVNQINNLKPDLVIFGGDYAVDNASAIRFFRNLPSIHSRYAIMGVIGEADRGDGKSDLDLTLLTDAMRVAGVVPLVNSVYQVRVGAQSIYVAGVDDFQSGKPDVASLASRVSVSDYVILVSHNPSIIPEAQAAPDSAGKLGWFDLGLFGHTHGGQIAGFSSLLDIAGDVEDRYQRGWMQENRVDMLISNGVGTSVIPARLFRPAQIHAIDVSLR